MHDCSTDGLPGDICPVISVHRWFIVSVSCLRGIHFGFLVALAATCALGAEARVRVRVRDGDTGQALADARVKAGDSTFFTDSAGECIVPADFNRRLVLTTTMKGCFPATDSFMPTVSNARLVVKLYGIQPRTVIGFVRDGLTGKPLPRATVRLKNGDLSRRADSAGMYSFPVPPGERELVAALPGYRGFSRRLSVRPGDTAAVDLPLYDAALVVGEIAGRIEVRGLGAACGANVAVEGTRLGTASDQNGRYIVTGVPAGTQRVVFTYAGCKKALKVVSLAAWQSLSLNVQLEQRLPSSRR